MPRKIWRRFRYNPSIPSTPAENARVVAQYRAALGEIETGRYSDAVLSLRAIIPRAPGNPLYQADLAYALLRAGRFEEAGNAYARAYQMLQANAWHVVGLAASNAGLRKWADAAGTIQLAAQGDSAVVTGLVASAAAGWFEQAGDRSGSLTWARLAVARTPDDAPSWLRIAKFLRATNDTTPELGNAIRRFRALQPDDRLGIALFADLLFNAGKTDSALALIGTFTQDTTYREFAAGMYLQAGRDLLSHRDAAGALRLLALGQPYATPSQQPAYSNLIGRAQLLTLNAAMTALQDNRSCAASRAADSLVTQTEQNLRAGISFDSARTVSMLESILPQYKANAAAAVRTCSDAPPAARPAPRPAARPRPRPY